MSDAQFKTQVVIQTNAPAFGARIEKFDHASVKRLGEWIRTSAMANNPVNLIDVVSEHCMFYVNSLIAASDHDEESLGPMQNEAIVALLAKKFPSEDKKVSLVSLDTLVTSTILDLRRDAPTPWTNSIWELHSRKTNEMVPLEKETSLVKTLVSTNLKKGVVVTKEARDTIFGSVNDEVENGNVQTFQMAQVEIIKALETMDEVCNYAAISYGMVFPQAEKPDNKKATHPSVSSAKSSNDKKPREPRPPKTGPPCNSCGIVGHVAGNTSCYYVWGKHPEANRDF